MYQCPRCDSSIPDKYDTLCPACKARLAFCSYCQRYTERQWHKSTVRLQSHMPCPQFYATCSHCGETLWDSRHIRKTGLYQHYTFSFKFMNRYTIPYAMYLNHPFPFGEIDLDLGLCVNPFAFESDLDEQGAVFSKTDSGPVRAYRVTYTSGTVNEECIVLSHESGLEVFTSTAGTTIARKIGRRPLHRSVDLIEASINLWWERYKSDYWGPSKVFSFLPLVERVVVRTPHWEFPLDDSYLQKDREGILDHIAANIRPAGTVAEFVATLPSKYLRKKIITGSRRIVKVM